MKALKPKYLEEIRGTIETNITWETFKALPIFQQRRRLERYGNLLERFYVAKITENSFYFGLYEQRVFYFGKRVYPKTVSVGYIMHKKGQYTKLTEHILINEFCQSVLSHFKYDWFVDIIKLLSTEGKAFCSKRYILKKVLDRTITNQEDLFKEILKKKYNTNKLSWKTLRKLLLESNFYSPRLIYDIPFILDYTTNPEITILKATSEEYNVELLHDCLVQASMLDITLNSKWGYSRLKAEHEEMSRIITYMEGEEQSDVPFFNPQEIILDDDYNAIQLNSAKELFFEAKEMHNCIFSNYRYRCEDKRYIVIHMDSVNPKQPSGISIGLSINTASRTIRFDQAYYRFNDCLEGADIVRVEDFLKKHTLDFLNMTNDIEIAEWECTKNYLPW